jgi:DDE family transposase
MKKDTTKLFCDVDDFTQSIKKEILSHRLSNEKSTHQPTRKPGLDESEIMTIILLFQESPCRNFKYFYTSYLQLYKGEFPGMPSYQRFVALMPRVLHLLTILLYCLFAKSKGISYIDATSLAVCHPKRTSRNKVFRGLAKLGKTTKGYFFGFKLHAIINEKGDLIRVQLTSGNVDDRKVVPQMTETLTGFLFGDKGYISKELFIKLYRRGLKLVTGIKKNMKNQLVIWREKILLRKRGVIETVFDYLKNKLQLEHTRHRSPFNMLVHVISTLIVYQLKPSKPSIREHNLLGNP